MTQMIVELKNIVKTFHSSKSFFGKSDKTVYAIRDVSLSIAGGETLGLVGESGCGKSTLGMISLKLTQPDRGKIFFDGQDITPLSQSALRKDRRKMQIIFQDPYASLNPRMRVEDIVEEPLIIHNIGNKRERKDFVAGLIKDVGLDASSLKKYPHEFSGGQRQRIGIARAIALKPKYIVADEPVSALDLSVRGEIINLLCELREKFSLTILFIAHDLKIVELISHRVCVMYLGKIMEFFPSGRLNEARHPYTQALVSAIPVADPSYKKKRIVLSGDVPSPFNPPSGCSFHPRCKYAKDICRQKEPPLNEYISGFSASCHFIDEMKDRCVGNL